MGAAVVLVLAVLRPQAPPGREALVVARPVSAGAVLSQHDLETRRVPVEALPQGDLPGEEVIGTRAAIALAEGTVLTTSMTSAALTVGLSPTERLVQVPIEVGAELAQPGARVDLIAQGGVAGSWSPGGPGAEDAVVCAGARVVMVQVSDDEGWAMSASRTKVTLVTLAVPAVHATLVVGAATNGALGLVLSP
ncbi:MAG: SAF domain-containing protein [Actinomyces sp.]|nr:SAF domain-containing protein [Actinomyces sp.]MDO4244298.1 SAF domain-containing protein [Actinomyces sp.]